MNFLITQAKKRFEVAIAVGEGDKRLTKNARLDHLKVISQDLAVATCPILDFSFVKKIQ